MSDEKLTTKELIRELDKLDLAIKEWTHDISIINHKGYNIAVVYKTEMGLNTIFDEFEDLKSDVQAKVFGLLVRYAKTPPEDREEPKKYYLRHKWMGHEKLKYLELDTQNDEWYLGHKYDTIFVTAKNEFTQEEINDIKDEYNTDLSDFEMVEVKDENPGSVGRFNDLEHGKQYYLRNFSNGIDMNENYLNFSKSNRSYILADRENDSWHQTKFTKKDIMKLITCKEIHLDDFDIVEVENE